MTNRTLVQGTVEYLDVTLTADVNLTGTVEFSLDRGATWLTAAWIGSAGTTRTARYLLTTATLHKTNYAVWVRLSDSPEVPILAAGSLLVI